MGSAPYPVTKPIAWWKFSCVACDEELTTQKWADDHGWMKDEKLGWFCPKCAERYSEYLNGELK